MEESFQAEIQTIEPQPILSIRVTTTPEKLGPLMGELFGEVWGHIEAQGGHPAGAPFSIYHSIREDEVDLESGMPVPEAMAGAGRIEAGELPGGRAVVVSHYGPYETLPRTHMDLYNWLQEQELEIRGPFWEVYLTDPAEEPDPNKWRTDIVWPVT